MTTVVQLQPLRIDGIVRVTIDHIRGRTGLVLGITAVAVMLEHTLETLVQPAGGRSVGGLVAGLGATAGTLLPIMLLYGLLWGTLDEAMAGRRVSLGSVWSAVAARLPGLVGLTVLVGLVLGALVASAIVLPRFAFGGNTIAVLPLVGAAGAGLAALWLGVGWSLAGPAYVFERLGVRQALTRSWKLVDGAWWRVFGVLLLAAVVTLAVDVLVNAPFGGAHFLRTALPVEVSPAGERIATTIASIIADTLTMPFLAGVTGALFVDQRIRRALHDAGHPPAATTPRRRGRCPAVGALVGVVVAGAVVAGVTVFPRLVPQHTVTAYTSYVGEVEIAQLDGRPIIVSGGMTGGEYTPGGPIAGAGVWDLASGALIRALPTDDVVNVVATAQLDGRPVAIANGRVWDLSNGEPIGPPLDHILQGATTAQLDGRPVIVSVTDRTARAWDLATRTPIGQPFDHGDVYPNEVYAASTSQLDGRPVIISGGNDGTVRVWDLASGTPIGQPLAGHPWSVRTMTTTQLEGRPVIISAGDDGTVRVWDLTSGTPIGQPLEHDGVVDVASAQLDGRPVIVSGGHDDTVRVWDLATGTPIGSPLPHGANVRTVATAQVDDSPVIISGDDEGIIRVWDPYR